MGNERRVTKVCSLSCGVRFPNRTRSSGAHLGEKKGPERNVYQGCDTVQKKKGKVLQPGGKSALAEKRRLFGKKKRKTLSFGPFDLVNKKGKKTTTRRGEKKGRLETSLQGTGKKKGQAR